jgi:hypothetical protein
MSKFQTGNIELQKICLDSSPKPDGSQRSISLKLTGSKKQPDIKTGANSPFLRMANVSHDANKKQSTEEFRKCYLSEL